MRIWTRLGIGVVSLFVAIAAGTGAYAMRGGSEPAKDATRADVAAPAAPNQPLTSAVCAPGHPRCVDTAIDMEPELTCEEAHACACGAGVCDASALPSKPCPAGVACSEPSIADPPPCAQSVPVDACYPNACPAGPYVCEQASGGTPPSCHPPYCLSPVEPDRAPVDTVPTSVCGPIYCSPPLPVGPITPDSKPQMGPSTERQEPCFPPPPCSGVPTPPEPGDSGAGSTPTLAPCFPPPTPCGVEPLVPNGSGAPDGVITCPFPIPCMAIPPAPGAPETFPCAVCDAPQIDGATIIRPACPPPFPCQAVSRSTGAPETFSCAVCDVSPPDDANIEPVCPPCPTVASPENGSSGVACIAPCIAPAVRAPAPGETAPPEPACVPIDPCAPLPMAPGLPAPGPMTCPAVPPASGGSSIAPSGVGTAVPGTVVVAAGSAGSAGAP